MADQKYVSITDVSGQNEKPSNSPQNQDSEALHMFD